ncbi:excitatory amino acid transporter 5-like, partial [Brachionichthys hirsutus]|uniref:excitatory amino acid transporter 5-like n=1 Tax=Brachionichthys hirsutus TaxID=412623 RepID=UPI003604F64F
LVSASLHRNMVPSNLVEATFQQYKTDLVPVLKVPTRTFQPNFVYVIPDENDPKGQTVYLQLTPPPEVQYKTSPGTSQQMNVLGIVVFSATMGLLLGRMGERGAPLINVCQCINECVMKIINAAVWYFPFGIVFLVAGKVLDMQDPSTLGRKLGWYGVTVLTGLFLHGLLLLPLFYFILTRKNPFSYIRGLLQAMVIALATSSSSATLPITMKCLLENCQVDRQIARFVLPVGATINMDGTALYEAVAAIFIAQVNDYELDFGQLVTISITATAASVGAAGIPQAGLVTMVIVLTSVGLPPDDITLIVAIDWVLDRFRTMINVLGDALAAGIVAHLCRKDLPVRETRKPVPSYGTQTPHNQPVPSYGTQTPHDQPVPSYGSLRDCVFEMMDDPAGETQGHTVYYNICQV